MVLREEGQCALATFVIPQKPFNAYGNIKLEVFHTSDGDYSLLTQNKNVTPPS